MDKINIVSSQAALEMSSFSTDTLSMPSSPLVNSLVKNRLFKTAPDIDEPDWAAVSTQPYYGFVCGRYDAAWQPISRNPQDWDLGCLEATGWAQESSAFLDAAVQLLHVRGAVISLLLQSRKFWWYLFLTSSMLLHDVIMTSYCCKRYAECLRLYVPAVRKRYHQNFLLCNNSEITACISDLFKGFCEEVYAVAFFTVVQQ